MKNLIFYDNEARTSLLPFTYTRPVADLRVGYLSIAEKWAKYTGYSYTFQTEKYLEPLFSGKQGSSKLYIAGNLLPDENLLSSIEMLAEGEGLIFGDEILCFRTENDFQYPKEVKNHILWKDIGYEPILLKELYQFQSLLEKEILRDIELLKAGKSDLSTHPKIQYSGNHPVWTSEKCKIGYCYIDTSEGPVYIGKGSEIMDGAMIKGPFILGEHSLVKMGAKIYKNVAIGNNCKVAGEIQSSILFGNSNKGHEGYLGNSVLGEWCNLGADTNNSNLKNNYEEVKLWSYRKQGFIRTGHQFLGLFMGDHSKSAINTMFNTGTVVGVSANIFGPGFPRNFIPSFSWGGSQGFITYQINKAIETAGKVYQRRGKSFEEQDEAVFHHIYEVSKINRNWER